MLKNIFLRSVWFRMIGPVLAGFLAYLLVLLFFDSLTNLSVNFLGQELLFTIILAYTFFESQHLIFFFFSKSKLYTVSLKKAVFLQIFSGLLVSILIVSSVISIYFVVFVGYSTYIRELFIFNSVFIVFSISYHLICFSIVLLQLKNEQDIEKEIKNRDAVLSELQAFQNDLHPEIFYSGFESLLVLIHTDKRKAEKYLSVFSEVYRYILDAKKTELVELHDEIKHLKNLVFLLNHRYENNISLSLSAMGDHNLYKIVPSTLQVILEYIVSENIVNKVMPLNIKISATDKVLLVKYNSILKLDSSSNFKEINNYSRKLEYFTGNSIKHETSSENETIIKVPFISEEIVEVEDEEL